MDHLNIKKTGSGYPVVLFHGWGFDHTIWKDLVQSLSSNYTFICVDLPGHGLTPNLPWHEFKEQLLSQVPGQFALLGWSLGGLFATRLALEVPDKITHLFLTNTSPYFIHDDGWPGIEARVFKAFYRQVSQNPKRTLKQFITEQCRTNTTTQPNSQSYEPNVTPNLSGLRSGLDILLNWDFRKQIEMLSMPTFYLFGGLDAIVPKATYIEFQKHYPKIKSDLIAQGAHALLLSHADVFQKILQGFIV